MNEGLPNIRSGDLSRFRIVVVAAVRVKQLRAGSKPRIEFDSKKRKDTSIAMEEVRRGLVRFTQLGTTKAVANPPELDAGHVPLIRSESPLQILG